MRVYHGKVVIRGKRSRLAGDLGGENGSLHSLRGEALACEGILSEPLEYKYRGMSLQLSNN